MKTIIILLGYFSKHFLTTFCAGVRVFQGFGILWVLIKNYIHGVLFLLTYADFRFTWKYIYPELCYSLLSWHYLFKNLYHEIGINLNIIKCFNSISISLIWPPYVCPIFIFSQRKRGLYINVIDNRRCDQNWTIQRHGQHWTPGKEL